VRAGTGSTDRVTIGRWHSRHLVPADHPAPERVQDTVDNALRRALPRALASHHGLGMGDPDELVFVRRLDIDLTVNMLWDDEAIATACAGSLLHGLVRELAGGDSHNVVRFRNRAEHVAAYLAWRAVDGATPPWYLRSFSGWELLSSSAAIRSAIIDDPVTGLIALRLLSAESLTQVIAAIEPADADLVMRALAAEELVAGSTAHVRTLLESCVRESPPYQLRRHPAFPLWLIARSSETVPLSSAVTVARFVAALVEAAEQSGQVIDAECLARATREPAVLTVLAANPDSRVLGKLASKIVAQSSSEPPQVDIVARSTRFGGLFMLLDNLPALTAAPGFVAATADAHDLPLQNLFAFWTLAHVVGPSRHAFMSDALWRDLLGIPPDFAVKPSEQEAAHLDAAASATFANFARRLPGFGASTAGHLWRNCLDVAARVDFEPDRVVVSLTRAPLALVLGLSGVSRGERRWPWVDARPFVLFMGDDR
jgi:hypothetical protein